MINHGLYIKPVITEAAFAKVNRGWYTFAVEKSLNRNQAAKIIEDLFGVKVLDVKSLIVKGSTKRQPRTRKLVKTSGYKKVMVRLAKDQKIDIFETGGTK